MKPGSLLVSNSFAVPGVEATEIWELADRRKTRLYLYEMNRLDPETDQTASQQAG